MAALSILSFLLLLAGASARHLINPASPIKLPIHVLPRDANATTQAMAVSGITPVSISSDRQTYYAVVQMGEIYLRVALDTASSDLWVVGSTCETKSCTAVPRYPLSYQSPTFGVVNNNETAFEAGYADGTVASGFVARETVRLANMTLPNQVFAVVTQSNLTFLDDVSGILGLGFPRLSGIPSSVTNSTPFFPALAQQGLLDYPLFGLSLTDGVSGSLSLGAIDTTIVANVSKIGWNKVVEFSPIGSESNTSSYLHWVTPMAAYSINNKTISPLPTYPKVTGNSSLALFDIGTSGIYGPYQDVERLFAQIDGSRLVDDGQWAIPCETVALMTFTFGQQTYTLEPTDYLIGPASGNPQVCLSWPRALSPSPDGIDWQFGGPFFRTVYTVFSYGINTKEAPRIGFYALNDAPATLSPTAVAAFLSSASATVATTLPNFLLSTPVFSTPSYTFNASVKAATGGIVASALATSTYSAIFGQKLVNATSMPAITPPATVTTILVTNPQGVVTTATSTFAMASIKLGVPPGFHNAANALGVPPIIPWLLLCFVSLRAMDFIL
ncbi:aspartic peptidase domain-containing protein [Mycena alexandri]|uniref:Aspartic peptidase domain-containing protein n=1 Tax=Mycena alexandri TaxID=1745969 RepID=A0AAD6SZ87_9AGAR|nr:aspartic peptidase domain-containing protein [Mycena alexandri]